MGPGVLIHDWCVAFSDPCVVACVFRVHRNVSLILGYVSSTNGFRSFLA